MPIWLMRYDTCLLEPGFGAAGTQYQSHVCGISALDRILKHDPKTTHHAHDSRL